MKNGFQHTVERVEITLHDTGSALAMLRLALWNTRAAEIPEVLTHLEALKTHLWGKLMQGGAEPKESRAEEDRLLEVEEASQRLSKPADWLYRQARKLPFTVRIGRHVRFSERGLERWIRAQAGRAA